MKTLLITTLFSAISFAATLTTSQLDRIRQQASAAVSPTYTKQAANIAAQGYNTWIEVHRAGLPNKIRMVDMTVAQKAEIDAIAPALRAAERNSIFAAVADLWEIVPPPAPDPLEPTAEGIRQELVRMLKVAIDAVAPNITAQERRRAIRLALDAL